MSAVVLFDGVCNLCNRSVDFIIDHDPAGYFRFAPLQSESARKLCEGCGLSPTALDTIVLVEDGACSTRSTAAFRICRHLAGPWRFLYALIVLPRPLRDVLYGWIAGNRYRWFGRRDTCRVPSPELLSRFFD